MNQRKKNMRAKFVPLLLPFLLAACAVGPDYVKPSVDTPAAFKEAPGNWQQVTGEEVRVPEAWWRIFNDPVLNELQDQVTIDNQNIKLAEAQYRAARATVDSASAAYYPTVTGNFGRTRAENAITTSAAGTQSVGAASPTTTYTLSASASWEADVWGRIRRNVESADASLEASAADLDAARVSAHALMAQTYIQLRGTEAQLDLYRRTVEAYARYLQLTKNRFSAGVATPLDVSNAESQLATAKASLIATELQRAQYEHAIAVLIGKPPASLILAATNVLPAQPATPQLVPTLWLATRPDLVAAERRVAAANAQIGVAKAAWFPALTLNGSAGYRNAELAGLTTLPHRFWSLGPALAMTLFDGGAKRAAVESASASYDQQVATYRQTVLTAFQEVEDNLASARLTGDEKAERQIAAQAARRAREIAENQYMAGTAGQLEVTTAQANELAAEHNLIDARQRHLLAAVQLYKNTGHTPVAAPTQSDVPKK